MVTEAKKSWAAWIKVPLLISVLEQVTVILDYFDHLLCSAPRYFKLATLAPPILCHQYVKAVTSFLKPCGNAETSQIFRCFW